MTRNGEILLTTRELRKTFGGVTAVDSVSVEVREGEIVGLVGPNGSGKTTTFDLIAGAQIPTSGKVNFGDKDVTGLGAARIARLGLIRTFQLTRVFPDLTVYENIEVAVGDHPERMERVWPLVMMTKLVNKLEDKAESLSYGQRKLLDIVRSVAVGGRLILLDEPFAGVNPQLVAQIVEVIRKIQKDEGTAFLLIDHDMGAVFELCDYVYVLESGSVMFDGSPDEVRHDPRSLEVYLGKRFRVSS